MQLAIIRQQGRAYDSVVCNGDVIDNSILQVAVVRGIASGCAPALLTRDGGQ